MATSVLTASSLFSVTALEDVLLDLLSDLLHEDPADLRTRLLAAGGHMPIDSLDLFDVMAEFRKRTGLKLPAKKMRRDTMRSVTALASFASQEGI